MTEELSALIVTRRPAKEMADGTLRVQIDVEPNDRRAFLDMFPDNGDPIAVAALSKEAIIAHQQGVAFAEPPAKKSKGNHGDFAQWLVQSGFFRRPDVWKLAGIDKDYTEWLKQQKCCIGTKDCDGDVVPAHVRRIADGSGTGIKPEYAAIPLCNGHHQLQHQKGESAIGGKEFCDRKRIVFVSEWAKVCMKAQLEIESLAALSPQHLELFLRGSDINVNIPTEYFHG